MKYNAMDDRVEKVTNMDKAEALKLIFQWVKTGVLRISEFTILLEHVK
jgi:hypothetical protein